MPQKTFFLLFLASLLSWSGQAWAQGKYVVGTVIDQTTKSAVNKVTVVNQRTRQRGRTNESGRFFMTVQPGDSLIITSQLYNRTGIKYDGSVNPVIIAKALPPCLTASWNWTK